MQIRCFFRDAVVCFPVPERSRGQRVGLHVPLAELYQSVHRATPCGRRAALFYKDATRPAAGDAARPGNSPSRSRGSPPGKQPVSAPHPKTTDLEARPSTIVPNRWASCSRRGVSSPRGAIVRRRSSRADPLLATRRRRTVLTNFSRVCRTKPFESRGTCCVRHVTLYVDVTLAWRRVALSRLTVLAHITQKSGPTV